MGSGYASSTDFGFAQGGPLKLSRQIRSMKDMISTSVATDQAKPETEIQTSFSDPSKSLICWNSK
jgi:hypothetical protein